ncbi:LCP family protein [Spongisporangium articulatum]|uniref:LCP family protein n=1 Tax=Spongisporangium articulatum TaxID=3362603 RepID=A0ABW8ARX3_9ACTN
MDGDESTTTFPRVPGAGAGPQVDERPTPHPGHPGGGHPVPGFRPGDRAPEPRRRTGRLWLRLVAIIGIIALVLAAVLVGGFLYLQHKYDSNIERFDAFQGLEDKDRPVVVAKDAQNILLLGSDSRISAGDASAWVRGAQRTDAIMLVHIPADRQNVTVTSIPRDSWVNIPGHGMNKINAGFSFGGPALEVKTIEAYTGVRIDHVVVLDFDGFQQVTDDLGGVRITIPDDSYDSARRKHWKAGTYTMDGETALTYVRQRHGLPGGDFDRVKRQQNWIRAIATKTLSKDTLTNPMTLTSVLGSITKAASVDDGFSIGEMRSTALSLRDVKVKDITFMTAPLDGTGWSPDGKQSIVKLNKAGNKSLWKAYKDDTVSEWLAAHPDAALGKTVR